MSDPTSDAVLSECACGSRSALPVRGGRRCASVDVGGSRAKITARRPTSHRRPGSRGLGIDVFIDDAFRETDAGWLPHEEFLSSGGHLFASPTSSPAAGWEPSRDAWLRFLEGVMSISRSRPDDDIVVCSGGRALTSLLVELDAIHRDLAFSCWQSIRMPDIAVVDMTTDDSPVMLYHFADIS